MAGLTHRELNRALLARQGVIEPISEGSARGAVERLGSLQAQHPEWPPVALAARAIDARTADLAGALERRMLAAHEVALAALADGPRTSLELDRLMAAEVGPIETPVQRIYWRHLAALVPMVHVPHDGEGYGRSRYAIATEWLGTERPELDLATAGPTSSAATSPPSDRRASTISSPTSAAAAEGSASGGTRSPRWATR